MKKREDKAPDLAELALRGRPRPQPDHGLPPVHTVTKRSERRTLLEDQKLRLLVDFGRYADGLKKDPTLSRAQFATKRGRQPEHQSGTLSNELTKLDNFFGKLLIVKELQDEGRVLRTTALLHESLAHQKAGKRTKRVNPLELTAKGLEVAAVAQLLDTLLLMVSEGTADGFVELIDGFKQSLGEDHRRYWQEQNFIRNPMGPEAERGADDAFDDHGFGHGEQMSEPKFEWTKSSRKAG